MISHLYFFDDLTHHLVRVVREKAVGHELGAEVARMSREYAAELIACLDGAVQDCTLVPWEHAVEQLAWLLQGRPGRYDLIIGQGANGESALRSLDEAYSARTGTRVAQHLENVRIARFLSDPQDPFHSDFELRTTVGLSVAERCSEMVAKLPADRASRVAVFDDCIQTGKGTGHVVDAVRTALTDSGREATVDTLSLIGCGQTLDHFSAQGVDSVTAVMLRGQTYPESWDWDVYFLKDFFLPNAIRFTDGTQHAYVEDEAWMARVFGGNPERAILCIKRMRAELAELGLLDALLEM